VRVCVGSVRVCVGSVRVCVGSVRVCVGSVRVCVGALLVSVYVRVLPAGARSGYDSIRRALARAGASGMTTMRTWAHTSNSQFPFQVRSWGGDGHSTTPKASARAMPKHQLTLVCADT
jgi:hypothetical protein